MALPNQIDDATPLGSDNASLLDDQIKNLKTFILDILGLTDDTAYQAGVATMAAAGLQSLLLQSASGDVGAAGRLGRRGIELQIHDGNGVRQPVMAMAKSAAAVLVTNTTTETTVFSTTIPASHISSATDGSLRLSVFGHVTNSSGAAHDLTVRASMAGSPFATVVTSVATGLTQARRLFEALLVNIGSTNNVRGHLTVFAEATIGQSDQETANTSGSLSITVEWDAALATLSFSKVYAMLEWLP